MAQLVDFLLTPFPGWDGYSVEIIYFRRGPDGVKVLRDGTDTEGGPRQLMTFADAVKAVNLHRRHRADVMTTQGGFDYGIVFWDYEFLNGLGRGDQVRAVFENDPRLEGFEVYAVFTNHTSDEPPVMFVNEEGNPYHLLQLFLCEIHPEQRGLALIDKA